MSSTLTAGSVLTEPTTGGTSNDYEDWFCVATAPWPCGCGDFVAHHITCMHLIIVWPEIDNPVLLEMCAVAKKHDRNPKVIAYKNEFGKCVSYYEVIANPNIQPHTVNR